MSWSFSCRHFHVIQIAVLSGFRLKYKFKQMLKLLKNYLIEFEGIQAYVCVLHNDTSVMSGVIWFVCIRDLHFIIEKFGTSTNLRYSHSCGLLLCNTCLCYRHGITRFCGPGLVLSPSISFRLDQPPDVVPHRALKKLVLSELRYPQCRTRGFKIIFAALLWGNVRARVVTVARRTVFYDTPDRDNPVNSYWAP